MSNAHTGETLCIACITNTRIELVYAGMDGWISIMKSMLSIYSTDSFLCVCLLYSSVDNDEKMGDSVGARIVFGWEKAIMDGWGG